MQTRHFPVATVFIIILNVVIFAIGLFSGEQTQIIQNYGFIPTISLMHMIMGIIMFSKSINFFNAAIRTTTTTTVTT